MYFYLMHIFIIYLFLHFILISSQARVFIIQYTVYALINYYIIILFFIIFIFILICFFLLFIYLYILVYFVLKLYHIPYTFMSCIVIFNIFNLL